MGVALPEPVIQVQFAKLLQSARLGVLQRETPSTNRFFRLTAITGGEGKEFQDFRSRLCSLTGIPDAPQLARPRSRNRRSAR